jgi:hypothetical protein
MEKDLKKKLFQADCYGLSSALAEYPILLQMILDIWLQFKMLWYDKKGKRLFSLMLYKKYLTQQPTYLENMLERILCLSLKKKNELSIS